MTNRDYSNWPLGSGSVDPTPWQGPGSQMTPMPSTGRAALTHPGGGAVARSNWAPLASWRSPSGEASPVACMINSSAEVWTQLGNSITAGTAFGGGSGVRGELAGCLRVTYGLGAVLRTFEADIRPGSFQLPPCDLATIEAQLFGHSDAPVTVEVSGALVGGVQPQPSRFTASQRLTMFTGRWELDDFEGKPNHYTDSPPAIARWVSMSSAEVSFPEEAADGRAFLYAQPPAGLYMFHDYGRRIFIGQPGQVSEMIDHSPYTVQFLGSADGGVRVLLRFYLEI